MAMTNAQKAARAAKVAADAAAKAPADTPPAPAVRETKGAGGVKETSQTVVVVCKMPRGMYLQLHQQIAQDQRVMGGGLEKRQVAMRVGDKVRLKPAVLPFGMVPNYPIVDGFSLTRDVDAGFWRRFADENQQFSMITEGLLAAFDTEADAIAYCRTHAKLQHGLEPLEVGGPKSDPRIESTQNPNVSDIEIDSDSKVRAA